MKANDTDLSKEGIEVEIGSFKEEKIFKLICIFEKLQEKSLIPFIWLFKWNRNALSNLIKYKVHLCINGANQVFGVDY